MPKDRAGKFHLNSQRASASDKAAPAMKPAEPAMPGMDEAPAEAAPYATIHDHGDGTGHTEMSDGMCHEHGNIEALKSHMDQFLNEEASEGATDGY